MRRILLLGSLLFATAAAAQASAPLVFSGICNASAAVALDDNRIIVADDEARFLSSYFLDSQRAAAPPLPIPGADGEMDIEAATVIDGRLVWIGSHGRNAKGVFKESRARIFASHRLGADGSSWNVDFSPGFDGLLPAIQASRDAAWSPLRQAIGDLRLADPALAPKAAGFNIEGMSVSSGGKSLLIGMRNPLTADGKAILFSIENGAGLADRASARALLGKLTTLDLGRRGIRDLAWSPAHRAYLIVAGQANDAAPGPGFAIFAWNGPGSSDVREITAFGKFADPSFHPEAIVPLRQRSGATLGWSKRVLLLSDDGKRPVGGLDSEDKKNPDKSFRALLRTID